MINELIKMISNNNFEKERIPCIGAIISCVVGIH
jgi:hypothetical protein